METPARKFTRLVDALDQLVNEETAIVREGEFEELAAVHRRAEPVVNGLAELGIDVADELARARVAGLLARRQHNIDAIESQLATTRAELQSVQESSHRVAKIIPLYGKPDAPALSRLHAAV